MKIIYLLLDAISYEHSWLSNQGYMPNLKNLTSEGVNFHNHYSVTHNTRGNLATMFYGASSSITGVMGRKQSFRIFESVRTRSVGFTCGSISGIVGLEKTLHPFGHLRPRTRAHHRMGKTGMKQ